MIGIYERVEPCEDCNGFGVVSGVLCKRCQGHGGFGVWPMDYDPLIIPVPSNVRAALRRLYVDPASLTTAEFNPAADAIRAWVQGWPDDDDQRAEDEQGYSAGIAPGCSIGARAVA